MRTNLFPRLMIVLSILLLPLMLFWLLWPTHAEATIQDTAEGNCAMTPASTSILVIYVLAFDNDPHSPLNLTPKYDDTVASIVEATAINSDVTALILADLDSVGDTHMLEASNGILTQLPCLPDMSGNLQDTITEYDSADGKTLGGFLYWARTTYQAPKNIFSYIGHGTFFAPETGRPIADLIVPSSDLRGDWPPLPTNLDVNPDFTDHHVPGSGSPSLITPYQLALALQKGSENGTKRFDVVDLVHCFAATIEELYEIAPYALTATGSSHYAFYDASMLKEALSELRGQLTAETMAKTIIDRYHQVHPDVGHPHSLVAVDLKEMDVVKDRWDIVATELLNEMVRDPARTGDALQDAAFRFRYLDTTFCLDQDGQWELAAPDQLADFSSVIQALLTQPYSKTTRDSLRETADALEEITIALYHTNDRPWFDSTVPPWGFHPSSGIGIFVPAQSMPVDPLEYHSWQALWYTHITSYDIGDTTIENPHPFRFIQPTGNHATWADVIYRYWEQRNIVPGVDVPTAFCMPNLLDLAPDVEIEKSVTPDVFSEEGDLLTYSLTIRNDGPRRVTNVVVTDKLPQEVQGISIQHPDNVSCRPVTGSPIVCRARMLEPDAMLTIQIVVQVVEVELEIANVGRVSAKQFDRNPSNNSATATAYFSGATLTPPSQIALQTTNAGTATHIWLGEPKE